MSCTNGKLLGLILETFLGGIVEIVLFMVLLHNSVNTSLIPVIRAAILGSILANLLLCLGFCFFVGGLRKKEQEFDEVISEVGNGQLLMAGFGLLIPSAFYSSLRGSIEDAVLEANVLHISRTTSVILLVAFLMQGTLTPVLVKKVTDFSLAMYGSRCIRTMDYTPTRSRKMKNAM